MIKINRNSSALTIFLLLSILYLFKLSNKLNFIQKSPFYTLKMGNVGFKGHGIFLCLVTDSVYFGFIATRIEIIVSKETVSNYFGELEEIIGVDK